MPEYLTFVLAWAAGAVLGGIFFGGLWWTVRKGLASRRPALWFSASLLLRVSLVLAGFYFVAGAHGARLVLCLVGFIMARQAVTRLAAHGLDCTPPLTEGPRHAP
jgi:F1F0 ATPase subunit 2